MSASVLVGLLCVVAIATLGVVAGKRAADACLRNQAIRSLGAWGVVVVVALAIWLIALTHI